MIEVFVAGCPRPQGSKRYLGNGIMVESSKQLPAWRADVRARLLDDTCQPLERFAGAVSVRLQFVMPRPASTPKRSTPPAIRRPDIDKLVRAVLDAVTSAGVWPDDSQVVDLIASKRLAAINEQAGCAITITALTPTPPPVDLDALSVSAGLFEVGGP